ncbi:MAG: SPOR domain-containing protein, partial [Burkholderiales bacterium]|nr:SPOR domain-containing protein [Burkholderiales bacterium]
YKILPGWEEAITDREFRRQNIDTDKEIYFLQVAAFPDPAGADNLKARLALSGIESKIQTAQLPDGKIWHRVRLGPFSDEAELNASRKALRGLKLEANLIKVRQQN